MIQKNNSTFIKLSLLYENVSRMRVCVDKSCVKQLLRKYSQDLFINISHTQTCFTQCSFVTDLDSINELSCQNSAATVII